MKIGKDDIKLAGGMGANFGEIVKMGIPVPEGFVVATASYDRLIQKYNLDETIQKIIENTDVEHTVKLFETSRKLKEMILSCEMLSEVESKIIEAYNKMLEHGIVSQI